MWMILIPQTNSCDKEGELRGTPILDELAQVGIKLCQEARILFWPLASWRTAQKASKHPTGFYPHPRNENHALSLL